MGSKLYLLPNLLDESLSVEQFLPAQVTSIVQTLDGLIAESEKMARRYLRKFLSHEAMQKVKLALLNEHSTEIGALLKPIEEGQTWGLISDAGLCCIADPGSPLVWLAREKKIIVEALVGPSAIVQALQLSGCNGQKFAFHGYLPKEEEELKKTIRMLEKREGTQIWIETPYRSRKMLEILLEVLEPRTKLALAIDLTLPSEKVVSQRVSEWRRFPLTLEKQRTVFLIERS